jgi:phage shock protein A
MLNGVSNSNSLKAFERMEEKVVQLEAQTEAIGKLGADELNTSFASLELGNAIDSELTAMKREILADKNQIQQQ